MMAETVVYSREFLFIKEMYERGELGQIQPDKFPTAAELRSEPTKVGPIRDVEPPAIKLAAQIGGAARHFAQRHLRVLFVKTLDHRQAARQRLHEINPGAFA